MENGTTRERGHERRYWDEARETLAPDRRRAHIEQSVKRQLAYVYEHIPFYRRVYDAAGFHPNEVETLDDFSRRVPVIDKQMLRDDQAKHPPFGSYLGVDPTEIGRVFGSSGTTGTPTIYGISQRDWARSAEAQAMAMWGAGVRPGDVVHFLFPFSMFVGGWAILHGTERLGATNFTAGGLGTARHIAMIEQLGSTVLAGTPSYCLHLADTARSAGVDLASARVHTLIVGGEPGGSLPGVVDALKRAYGGARIIDTGNTSECYPTQMNSSCSEETGVHVYEDEVLLEIVDPDDPHVPVPEGDRGATVYTTLERESQPMIRFWAGDETYLTREPCPCGRTYPRLPEGLLGRRDDMLLVRGANVYPSAIDSLLRKIPGVGAEYRIILDREGALDEFTVSVERQEGDDTAEQPDALISSVQDRIRASIGLRCRVDVVPAGTYEVQTFKAKRVIDRR
jgi:phenylacetate-CoA ligase